MVDITDEIYASRYAVLQDLFNNKISLQQATSKLASISLSDDDLNLTWNLIINCACEFPERHDKLVDVLVCLSKLPDATTDQGVPLKKYGLQVWRDLPMFDWELREEWDVRSIPPSPPACRQKAISNFINLNKFTALLMATGEPILEFSWFALIALSTALETPPNQLPATDPLDAYIPAAAAWIETLGVDIYQWDEEHEHRPLSGIPGEGGPLWKGKHSFCKERWRFWRERFGEMAQIDDDLGEGARIAAREAELMMRDIENGDVEE
ncbi:hypothetical protein DTO212C5_6548 [Paecilomyces variotii]|nr:hypothetical protein DTO195F2_3859 [Paecilomyces variotii]KAJ9265987.1 hypothetical protein DTO212C5_6548 [Paecilomyces variotii]KAJ9369336.1 hypothetical protein DTO282E5_5998 [Paecilomyces variotii]KAJ9398900.1 hypothetical protein DTO282F9_4252 [Paecilomyces variotii]